MAAARCARVAFGPPDAARVLFSHSACAGDRHGFYLSMDNVHETERRWWGVGEFVLWIVFYFWAVWIFNAFLPPKPEQTPFETYLGNQLRQQTDGGASAERGQRLDDGTVEHSLQR